MSVDTAIILAAGIGSRLYPLTRDVPKCLIDLDGTNILKFQLEKLKNCGFRKVIISIGGFADKVEIFIKELNLQGLEIILEFNPFYFCSNNLVSLWSVRSYMTNGFVLLNGDIIFDEKMLESLSRSGHDVNLGCRPLEEFDDDDMKITIRDGLVVNVNKDIHRDAVDGESLGMIKFSSKGSSVLVQNLEKMVRQKDYLNTYYLAAISRLAEEIDVHPCYLEGKWFEMDFWDDYVLLKKEIHSVI